MKQFNVLVFDFNHQKIEPYNIIPYLVRCYEEGFREKPKTFDEFKKFVEAESKYQWWSRCEYEMVVSGFPPHKQEKIDVHKQVMMNIDLIVELLMESVNK